MKTVFSGIAALGLGLALVGCGSPTIGGQFAEPAYGWQRNGTYILTPTEMAMDCDGLVIEQGKAAKAIAYVDDVRGQRFGESLVISGVAAIFGLVRLHLALAAVPRVTPKGRGHPAPWSPSVRLQARRDDCRSRGG